MAHAQQGAKRLLFEQPHPRLGLRLHERLENVRSYRPPGLKEASLSMLSNSFRVRFRARKLD